MEEIDQAAIKNGKHTANGSEEKINLLPENQAVPAEQPAQPTSDVRARLLAFYLPQFHPIPENDEWWGKNFTEWTNVTKAQPLFPGHHQPQLPAELGFYDLRSAETRQAQADLAREYGIYGFCYYHYWFKGRRLLEQPFEQVLASGQPDFPFSLCWANENWTRRWDGEEDTSLIRQEYSDEDDLAHIRSLAPAFRDKRYIRIDNKPLFLVYNVTELPDPIHTTNLWREEALKMGFDGLYLCRVESRIGNRTDLAEIGFDASVEFPPHEFYSGTPRYYPGTAAETAEASILSYPTMVNKVIDRVVPKYKQFPGVMPSFDNTARRAIQPYIVQDSTPELYEQWLDIAIKKLQAAKLGPEENFIFINAWNEWGEGNHLEPDLKWGRSYLEATRRAVTPLKGADYWQLYDTYLKDKERLNEIPVLKKEQEQLRSVIKQHGDVITQLREALEKTKETYDALKETQQNLDSVGTKYFELAEYTRSLEGQISQLTSYLETTSTLKQRFEFDLRALQGTHSVRLTRSVGLLKRQWQKSLNTTAHVLAGPLFNKFGPAIEGGLDLPAPQTECNGKIKIAGWAISHNGPIPGVEVWLDDKKLAELSCGLPRPDVLEAQPWQPLENCGFAADLEFDAEQTGVGPHELRIVALNATGQQWRVNRNIQVTLPVRAALTAEPGRVTLSAEPVRPQIDADPYNEWLKINEPSQDYLVRQTKKVDKLTVLPLISIITPVYNPPVDVLRATVNSVRYQTYPYWELCLADASIGNAEVRDTLLELAASDERIKIKFLEKNLGIAGNSNMALKMASGEFIALLDHDDELTPNALFENVDLLNKYRDADMIYSDEDKVDEEERRSGPFFKPDWSPELFLSMMYTCHLGVYRASLVKEIGGFREGFDGAQDYDLVLRVIERTDKIYHIPHVLYHWRMLANSTAASIDAKDYARQAQIKAVKEYCIRNGLAEIVEPGLAANTLRVRYKLDRQPLVSIIIPTRDHVSVLRTAIDSILAKTNYSNFEIIVVDNESVEKTTLSYFAELTKLPNAKVLAYPYPFNFSAINNFATKEARGEFLLFLNNDIEVIEPEWLEAMVEQAIRPEIGVVGARLLYPDNSLQHGGVILGIGGVAGHAHKYLPADQPGYASRALAIQNFSAVTGACLMIKASLFEEIGGFNEKNLAIAFNDIDLCLKVRERGLRIVWTPYAKLYHHESVSRGQEDSPQKIARFQSEIRYMQQRWSDILRDDPYYNPNLTLTHEDFSLDIASRVPLDGS